MARFKQKFEATESNQAPTPEQILWGSVLSKAAHDAIYTSDWLEARKAISWFKSQGKDFRDVCEYAGRNPKYVHDKLIKEVMKREQYFQNLKFESSERRRVNEARKMDLQSLQG